MYCFNLLIDILEVLGALAVSAPDSVMTKKSVDSFVKSSENVGKPLILTLAIYSIYYTFTIDPFL